MAQYSDRHGGVGAPVGLTVFKTAGGSLGAVPGGFDSHTPLPKNEVLLLARFSSTWRSFTFGFTTSASRVFWCESSHAPKGVSCTNPSLLSHGDNVSCRLTILL